jgi:hypothetical protein
MKKLLVAFICLSGLNAYSQQKTEYYTSNWKKTDDKSQMAYYRVIEYTGPTTCKGPIVYYYANGVKQSECYASYVDPVDEEMDLLEGTVFWYDTQGKLSQVGYFEKGSRLSMMYADEYNKCKFKTGDVVEVLAQSGDQDIWIPAKVTLMKGSSAYRLDPLLLGWGIFNTYEEYIRTPQPVSIKLIMPSGASEPGIEALAKKELLVLRPGAVVTQVVMNGSTWSIEKDWKDVPVVRIKNGYVVYNYNGACYTMHFLYDEPYENGAYQKINSIKFEYETPYMCK